MIIAPLDDGDTAPRLRLITQNDHAHFAAQLLALWHHEDLPDHPRRKSLLFAARQHDNGWLETDSAPPSDTASGRPYDFMTIPQWMRQEIWQRGVQRYAQRDPYASLLILQHALHLHQTRLEDPEWTEIHSGWQVRRDEILAELELDAEVLMDDYRWIDLTDHLSLLACSLWTDPLQRHGYKAHLKSHLIHIDPFPLVGATTFRIPCREIAQRPYRDSVDLATELAMARWQELEIKVAPVRGYNSAPT